MNQWYSSCLSLDQCNQTLVWTNDEKEMQNIVKRWYSSIIDHSNRIIKYIVNGMLTLTQFAKNLLDILNDILELRMTNEVIKSDIVIIPVLWHNETNMYLYAFEPYICQLLKDIILLNNAKNMAGYCFCGPSNET